MKVILDAKTIRIVLADLADRVLSDIDNASSLAVVGIRSRGEVLAQRLTHLLADLSQQRIPCGTLDITLYRDDLNAPQGNGQPRVRTTEIDFDIDGKLVGNWFLEGTDFTGNREDLPVFCGDNLCPYWTGHLAFVYDFVNPTQTRVSFGDYNSWNPQGPYGVKGNIDPAEIAVGSGLVKLELLKAPGKDEALSGNQQAKGEGS